jgi:hypothetical protein
LRTRTPTGPCRIGTRTIGALAAVVAILLSLALAPPSGAASVSTVPAWDGTTLIGPFGSPDTATYGQVVTVPAGESRLSGFTFYVEIPTALTFRAFVYAWNEAEGRATGPALFEGPDTHTTEPAVFQPITVNVGSLSVSAEAQYVLFFSISHDQASDEGVAHADGRYGRLPTAAPQYEGGNFVFENNEYNDVQWTGSSWSSTGSDLAFSAEFTGEPSISSVPLLTAAVPVAVQTKAPACVVPTMRGLSLTKVRAALAAARCKLGKILYHYNAMPKGGLSEQDRHEGTSLPVTSVVNIWLSLGRHHKHHRRAKH